MNLSPAIIDAMCRRFKTMGFRFDPEGLLDLEGNGDWAVGIAAEMGLPSEEIAELLIEKIVAAHIDHFLPKCVRPLGKEMTVVSMPLEAGSPVTSDQVKRAVEIAAKLAITAPAGAES
jgi:hypothetical protein